MGKVLKVLAITIGTIAILGMVAGAITWGVLASRGPEPPELKPLDWWEHCVLYQIYPRSFKDSDGDGIGDLQGIISELEHFPDAGIDAIWMSPIFESPMIDFGYDISNFYKIHEEYGTMEDFEELLEKAHSLVCNKQKSRSVWLRQLVTEELAVTSHNVSVLRYSEEMPPASLVQCLKGLL